MRRLAFLLLSFFFIFPVYAKDPLALNIVSPWYKHNAEKGWHFDLGLGVEYEPTYAGSKNYDVEPNLFGRATYKTESGHRYYLSLGEIGASYALSPSIHLLGFLELEEGRETGEEPILKGLNEIDSTVEGQLTLAKRFGNKTLFATLQPDLTGDANKGLVWFVGGSYDWLSKNDKWRFSATADLSGADSEYMNTEFGITNQESLNTGYSAYSPSGGLKSLSLGLSSEYYINKKLSVLSNIEVENYLGDASDSPLIKDLGSNTGVEASALLRWRF